MIDQASGERAVAVQAAPLSMKRGPPFDIRKANTNPVKLLGYTHKIQNVCPFQSGLLRDPRLIPLSIDRPLTIRSLSSHVFPRREIEHNVGELLFTLPRTKKPVGKQLITDDPPGHNFQSFHVLTLGHQPSTL